MKFIDEKERCRTGHVRRLCVGTGIPPFHTSFYTCRFVCSRRKGLQKDRKDRKGLQKAVLGQASCFLGRLPILEGGPRGIIEGEVHTVHLVVGVPVIERRDHFTRMCPASFRGLLPMIRDRLVAS